MYDKTLWSHMFEYLMIYLIIIQINTGAGWEAFAKFRPPPKNLQEKRFLIYSATLFLAFFLFCFFLRKNMGVLAYSWNFFCRWFFWMWGRGGGHFWLYFWPTLVSINKFIDAHQCINYILIMFRHSNNWSPFHQMNGDQIFHDFKSNWIYEITTCNSSAAMI